MRFVASLLTSLLLVSTLYGAKTTTLNEEIAKIQLDKMMKHKVVNGYDKFGLTPLIYAAVLGDHRRIKELISRGAKVNKSSKTGHMTPLNQAIEQRRRSTAELLIRYGALLQPFDFTQKSTSHQKAYAQELNKLLSKLAKNQRTSKPKTRVERPYFKTLYLSYSPVVRVEYTDHEAELHVSDEVVNTYKINEGNKLVFDLKPSMEATKFMPFKNHPAIEEIRMAGHQRFYRVVIDFKEGVPFKFFKRKYGFVIRF